MGFSIFIYHGALGYVRNLGHIGNVKLWWKKARLTLNKGLKALLTDDDAGEVASYAEDKKVKENNSNDDNSDDSVRDVHFDDGDEERNMELHDGFDIHEPGEAEAALKEKLKSMKMKFVIAEGSSSSPLEEQNA
ncbi:hypothetical protein SESBI_28380 [Sesbania bispinosa]|nr:hypothetical protein SESBI_28380 [Sesbania bispinosa]